MTTKQQEFEIVALATMRMKLAHNLGSQEIRVGVYKRTGERTDEFMAAQGSERDFRPPATLQDLVRILTPPRAILIMVKAGQPVDDAIDSLTALLEPGDTIIDGANSLFHDTRRRVAGAQ